MDHSMPGLPVHHQLLEFTQTHLHWVGDDLFCIVLLCILATSLHLRLLLGPHHFCQLLKHMFHLTWQIYVKNNLNTQCKFRQISTQTWSCRELAPVFWLDFPLLFSYSSEFLHCVGCCLHPYGYSCSPQRPPDNMGNSHQIYDVPLEGWSCGRCP